MKNVYNYFLNVSTSYILLTLINRCNSNYPHFTKPDLNLLIITGDGGLIMETVNLNNSSVFLGGQTSPPLPVTSLRQVEPDTLLVGFDNRVSILL